MVVRAPVLANPACRSVIHRISPATDQPRIERQGGSAGPASTATITVVSGVPIARRSPVGVTVALRISI